MNEHWRAMSERLRKVLEPLVNMTRPNAPNGYPGISRLVFLAHDQ